MIRFLFLILFLSCQLFNECSAEENLSDTIKELQTKANAGDTEAQFRLASAYDSGRGVAANGKLAMKWYLAAANAGYAEAQNSVGSGYQADRKYKEALFWYQKAANQNHPLAINNLAYLYDLGLGVKQDREKAFELYNQSANLGWTEAMWNLANVYGSGQHGDKDTYTACLWTYRAYHFAADDDLRLRHAVQNILPYLEKNLGSEKYEACIKEANEWKPTNNSRSEDHPN